MYTEPTTRALSASSTTSPTWVHTGFGIRLERLSTVGAGDGVHQALRGIGGVFRKRLDPPDLMVVELAFVFLVRLHGARAFRDGIGVFSVQDVQCLAVTNYVGPGGDGCGDGGGHGRVDGELWGVVGGGSDVEWAVILL